VREVGPFEHLCANNIVGPDTNDILTVGDGNLFGHYNGAHWTSCTPLPRLSVNYYNCDMRANALVATAVTYGLQKALAVIGRR
jgi:hypothetical protein